MTFFNLDFIYLFSERGREGEKDQCVRETSVASRTPPIGDPPATQACALTGNRTGDLLFHRPAPNPLSHVSQGMSFFLFIEVFYRPKGKIY